MASLFILTILISFLLSPIAALPLAIESRAVSQTLLDQLSFYEQYAAAAYCPANNSPGSTTAITCEAGNCPLVQTAGAQSVLEFQDVGISDATGYVALDHTNGLIVISFRGSRSVRNFIADINFALVPWSICTGCSAHAGFLESWQSVRSIVQGAVEGARVAYPNYKIVSTGHSLGGALATLAAADLRKGGYTIDLFTYGSPMVGNRLLATFITGQTSANFRVTHAQDVVPKLPGYAFGFAHVSPEYWVTSATGVAVTSNDIQVSSGVVNFKGNQGTLGNSIDDHLWYFNNISGCGGDTLEFKE
ncbi:hypothetical protein LTR84_009841 [Exophiala bonariae]|uniref:Fungal lipase-like domain-containing protein n=1 Tax=Exophiala bonariae TaxID=1690606 RepID=A0AAV9NJW2_9EURO|nr:hypothetical protein LTR84_009841 [Exophiala bonariae]